MASRVIARLLIKETQRELRHLSCVERFKTY
jgi:hypothetical protein